MNLSQLSSAALLAASLLAVPALAQGHNDTAPVGGTPNVHLVPGPMPSDDSVVIYNNGPVVNSLGTGAAGADESVLQTVSLGHNVLGHGFQNALSIFCADDFTVPAGQIWCIDEIQTYAYQTSSPTISTITGLFVQIYDGDPSAGGNLIYGDRTTNVMTSTGWSNAYRVTETSGGTTARAIMDVSGSVTNLVLKAGTYWVELSATGSLGSGPWIPPVTITGVNSTGNGLQEVTAAWTPMQMSNLDTNGLPFKLCGEVACCWDSNLGTNLNHGDDTFTAGIALPFNFPYGLASSTSLVGVSANGTVALDNVGLGTQWSTSLATFQGAQVLGLWDDFNPGAGGGVYVNVYNKHAVFTWYKVESFQSPNTPDESTVQIQMFCDGTWTLSVCRHDVSWRTTVIGGISDALLLNNTAIDLSLGGPSLAFMPQETFSGGGSDLAGLSICFSPDGIGGYDVVPSPACCAVASAIPYGNGCDNVLCLPNGLPIMGQVMSLHTDINGTPFPGVVLVGITQQVLPLVNLGLNAPGCDLLHDNLLPFLSIDALGNTTIGIPCLSGLLGGSLQFQGIVFAGANPFGLSLSNGVTLTIGAID